MKLDGGRLTRPHRGRPRSGQYPPAPESATISLSDPAKEFAGYPVREKVYTGRRGRPPYRLPAGLLLDEVRSRAGASFWCFAAIGMHPLRKPAAS
jgi:hypothetical protein